MPIALITGPANAGKARAVLDALRREARSAGASPLLVVPTAADVELYRRELAERGPTIGVEVTLFSGLIERIVASAAVADPKLAPAPIGTLARERMLCTLAAEVSPRLAGARSGLGRALASAIGELELASISPAALRGASGEDELGDIYRSYERRLRRIGRLDPELRQRRALDLLRRSPSLWRGTPVLLYGFDDLTALELDAIETLGRVVDARVTVSLAYEPGRIAFAGRAWAFQELLPQASSHVELGPNAEHYAPQARTALHRLERRIFEVGDTPETDARGEADRWGFEVGGAPEIDARGGGVDRGSFEVGGAPEIDARGEADRWGFEVGGAPEIDARGGEADQLALELGGSPEIDAREVESSLLPIDPGTAVRLLEGGSERAELELVAEEVRALIDAGVDPEEIAIVHREPARVAEELRVVLDAARVPHAIVLRPPFGDTSLGGALLGLLACGCRQEAGREGATLGDLLAWLRAPGVLEKIELADRLEARALRTGALSAAAARQLWEREHWPLERIDRVRDAAARGPVALIDRAQRDLISLFSARRVNCAAVLGEEEAEQELALRAGIAALAELRELASADGELLGGSEGLLEALACLALQRPRAAPAGAVAVLDPLALRARRVRALFLCGLQEGTFPRSGAEEAILSERRLREATGLLRRRPSSPTESFASERYLFYATLSRPEEALFLSWHVCGDDGASTPPSLFVDDVRDLFHERLWHERRLRGAGALAPQVSGPARDAPPLFAKACDGAERGLFDERVLAELRERRMWSASSLERWAACPMSWFVERLLSADGLDPDPEPLLRGSLAHAVLSDVHAALKERCGSARMIPSRLKLAEELATQALRTRAEEFPLSVSPERLPAATRRLEADLKRYLQSAAEQESPLEPTHLELPFGFPEDPESLGALELGGGLQLRGRIDRIDVGEQGEAVVYDYKSGRVSSDRSASKWIERSYFQMGLYVRAVQELTSLHPIGGLYQPLSGDLRARGALRTDVASSLSCVRTDSLDGEELDELVSEVSFAAVTAAGEARTGRLEPRPDTCAYRGGCMYPTICRCGR